MLNITSIFFINLLCKILAESLVNKDIVALDRSRKKNSLNFNIKSLIKVLSSHKRGGGDQEGYQLPIDTPCLPTCRGESIGTPLLDPLLTIHFTGMIRYEAGEVKTLTEHL